MKVGGSRSPWECTVREPIDQDGCEEKTDDKTDLRQSKDDRDERQMPIVALTIADVYKMRPCQSEILHPCNIDTTLTNEQITLRALESSHFGVFDLGLNPQSISAPEIA
jgi:hypothetical protein